MTQPLISIVSVSNRKPFLETLLRYNVQRQLYPRIQWIVADSSAEGAHVPEADIHLRMPGNEASHINIATQTNAALKHVKGDWFTFWDDDDWQHPLRLQKLIDAYPPEAGARGWTTGWFYGLHEATGVTPHFGPPHHINSLWPRKYAETPFPNTHPPDTHWCKLHKNKAKGPKRITPLKVPFVHSLWLCHNHNTSQRKGPYTTPLPKIDAEHWGDTDLVFEKLKTIPHGL